MKVELKFKEAIESRGLTQKKLAELTGIRPSAISFLTRGYIERLNLDHLERIAKVLDIEDINELVTLKKEDSDLTYGNAQPELLIASESSSDYSIKTKDEK